MLSFIIGASFEASVDYVEDWIVRATCDQYEISGVVRDVRAVRFPYAVVEVSYLDEQLATRSNTDGSFAIAADERVCDRRPPRNVQLLVLAEDFRPEQTSVPYDEGSVEVTLDARDFN